MMGHVMGPGGISTVTTLTRASAPVVAFATRQMQGQQVVTNRQMQGQCRLFGEMILLNYYLQILLNYLVNMRLANNFM